MPKCDPVRVEGCNARYPRVADPFRVLNPWLLTYWPLRGQNKNIVAGVNIIVNRYRPKGKTAPMRPDVTLRALASPATKEWVR